MYTQQPRRQQRAAVAASPFQTRRRRLRLGAAPDEDFWRLLPEYSKATCLSASKIPSLLLGSASKYRSGGVCRAHHSLAYAAETALCRFELERQTDVKQTYKEACHPLRKMGRG